MAVLSKYTTIVKGLYDIGVDIKDIAMIVHDEQKHYIPDITMSECIDSVNSVLHKYEVQHPVLVALFLDKATNDGLVDGPLKNLLETDAFNFGVDEVIVKSALNVFGSVADTNFGYLDKVKPGIIGVLNDRQKQGNGVTIFMDDAVAAIAACAEARIVSKHAPIE